MIAVHAVPAGRQTIRNRRCSAFAVVSLGLPVYVFLFRNKRLVKRKDNFQ